MTFEVETRGTRRTVEVQRRGQQWSVTLDGRTMVVSVRDTGNRWSLLVGEGAARSYEVTLGARINGERIVHVNGFSIPVTLLDPREGLTERSTAAVHAAGPRSITAPMPGRIVKVLVKAGDRVAPHQGLVVIEAMKMENELRAPKPGVVTDVRVTDGMSVEAKAVLIVLE